MFEKRLRGYRAIGYARNEAPLGLPEIEDGTGGIEDVPSTLFNVSIHQ